MRVRKIERNADGDSQVIASVKIGTERGPAQIEATHLSEKPRQDFDAVVGAHIRGLPKRHACTCRESETRSIIIVVVVIQVISVNACGNEYGQRSDEYASAHHGYLPVARTKRDATGEQVTVR